MSSSLVSFVTFTSLFHSIFKAAFSPCSWIPVTSSLSMFSFLALGLLLPTAKLCLRLLLSERSSLFFTPGLFPVLFFSARCLLPAFLFSARCLLLPSLTFLGQLSLSSRSARSASSSYTMVSSPSPCWATVPSPLSALGLKVAPDLVTDMENLVPTRRSSTFFSNDRIPPLSPNVIGSRPASTTLVRRSL